MVVEEEEAPNGFHDWEHLLSSSTPLPPPNTTSYTADDRFLSIFPPINHEGLPVASPLNDSHHYHPATATTTTSSAAATTPSLSPSPALPCPSPSNSHTNDPSHRQRFQHSHSPFAVSPVGKWVSFALRLMNSKVLSIFSPVRSRGFRFLFPSESSVSGGGVVAGGFLMVLGVWIWWRRRRRRPRVSKGDTVERLNLLIREKDQKIIELLNQVAELNKLLIARYRVPVVREC